MTDGCSRVQEPAVDGDPHEWFPALQLAYEPNCRCWLTSGVVDGCSVGWWPPEAHYIPIAMMENCWGTLLQMAFPQALCPPFTEGNHYINMPLRGMTKEYLDNLLKSYGENYNDLAYAYWRMYVLEHILEPSSPMYNGNFKKEHGMFKGR
jgi:hypothetical protein